MYYGLGSILDSHSVTDFREDSEIVSKVILQKAEDLANEAQVECSTYILMSDSPFKAILETVHHKDCDLIFMASHGRKGVNNFFLGSETNKVLSHSTVPILVYR